MTKRLKQLTAGLFVAAGFIFIGMSSNGITYAANTTTNDTNTLSVTTYTLEEMLTSAIDNEYQALAQYNAILDQYGIQQPFYNLSKSEQTHIDTLLILLETYNVEVPTNDYDNIVNVPTTLEEAYQTGLVQEENTIEMYKNFLNQELPNDIKVMFEQLSFVSTNHVRAFQNIISGNCTGYGMGYGKNPGRTMGGYGGCRGFSNNNTTGNIYY